MLFSKKLTWLQSVAFYRDWVGPLNPYKKLLLVYDSSFDELDDITYLKWKEKKHYYKPILKKINANLNAIFISIQFLVVYTQKSSRYTTAVIKRHKGVLVHIHMRFQSSLTIKVGGLAMIMAFQPIYYWQLNCCHLRRVPLMCAAWF